MSRAHPHRHAPASPEPEPSPPASGRRRRLVLSRRAWGWILLVPLVLVVVFSVVDVAIDRPLRGFMEKQANSRLRGYTARIGAIDFNPWNFSLDVFRMTITQDAHPAPPVAEIPFMSLNVQWHALLRGRIVADMRLEHPRFFVDLAQLEQEWKDPVPIKERGWQEALFAMYPLKVNELKVLDAAVTYLQADARKPLQLTRVTLTAYDIRNVRSRPGVYPSPVHLDATVFDSGRAVFDGHANFLLEPFVGLHVVGRMDGIPLDRLEPLVDDYHVHIRHGTLAAGGRIEWSPTVSFAHLGEVVLAGIEMDYVSSPGSQDEEAQIKRAATQAAEKVTEEPGMLLRMDRLRIVESTVSYVSRFGSPGYRAFLSGANVTLENLSNQPVQGEARLQGSGAFMGSGKTTFSGTFRPDKDGADFDVAVKIESTDMTRMNDMFRTYANVDVSAGQFSFYSELAVKNGQVKGYVKPLFEDVNVYTRAQDKKKGFFKKIWEGMVEGFAKLLENRQDEVATVATVKGTTANPKASTLEILAGLIENAFVDAILPGFERQLAPGKTGRSDRKGKH
ncbi:MAG TPA: DUF748 domain-containing protein [Candidatus Polarisedimenticolaceae bacterium]|nr:DUF748 domain-containing protein [Candidatus Polarisedimenticolaceae bacterium]